ncbi:hypothetical protein [Aquiflexum lacus]|uniref:hypothetical protein n=1 Tax=Aquiflexum lacus TaxID=2483805 RepID=UPI001893CB42|nr:hypothetical protein [Aquiflexum lacus]
MRDETIRDLLRNLNKGKGKNLVFKSSIGGNIEFAKVWIYQKNGFTYKSQFFFLIKNDLGKYVAAVCGFNNLHWYTLFEERRKGYLSKALKEYIIPFIWGKELHPIEYPINISISRGIGPRNFKASINLAKSIGFKCANPNEDLAEMNLNYNELNFPTNKLKVDHYISKQSIDSIKQKTKTIIDIYNQIKDEIFVKVGNQDLDEFDIPYKLSLKLDAIFWEYENKISH